MANENYLTYKQKKKPVQFNKKTQIINRKIGKGDIQAVHRKINTNSQYTHQKPHLTVREDGIFKVKQQYIKDNNQQSEKSNQSMGKNICKSFI